MNTISDTWKEWLNKNNFTLDEGNKDPSSVFYRNDALPDYVLLQFTGSDWSIVLLHVADLSTTLRASEPPDFNTLLDSYIKRLTELKDTLKY